MIKGITLESKFRSAPVVLPCVQAAPEKRPNIAQLLRVLDDLIRGVLTAVRSHLPGNAQPSNNDDDLERELIAVYKRLLDMPPHEVDALVDRAFSQPAPVQSPPPRLQHQPNARRLSIDGNEPPQVQQAVAKHLAPHQAAPANAAADRPLRASANVGSPSPHGEGRKRLVASQDAGGAKHANVKLSDSSDEETPSASVVIPGSLRLVSAFYSISSFKGR